MVSVGKEGGKKRAKHGRALSIGALFSVVLTCIALAAGGTVSVWRGYQTYEREQEARVNRDSRYAHTLARSVSIFLDSAATSVQTLASEAQAEPALDAASMQPLVERFAVSNEHAFISMYIIGTNGIEVADYYPAGADDAERLEGIGLDLSDRPYVQAVLSTGEPTVSHALIGRSTDVPVVVVSAPIFSNDGSVAGIAAGSLSLGALTGLAAQATTEDAVFPVVVDAVGRVVVHQDQELVSTTSSFADLEPAVRSLAGEQGFIDSYVEPSGSSYTAAYAPVAEYGWGVWVAQDTSTLTSAALAAARDAMISFAIILTLAGITFFFSSRLIFLPLRRIAKQVEQITAGRLGGSIDLKGTIRSSEVSVLTEKFNQMSTSLKESLGVKSQFLDVVSHVFRTPITILKWQSESWLDRSAGMSDEQRQSWVECAVAAQRLQLALDNVLVAQEITKLGVVRPVQPGTIDLVKLLRDLTSNFATLAKKQGVTVTAHVSGPVRAYGDAQQIRNAFEAVIANAVLYSEKGDVVTASLDQVGEQAVFTVVDTGIGISPREYKMLFTPFFRGGAAVKKYTDGTGLGLFIAKSFIESHRGTIVVRSRVGRGTTVVVRLPTTP